MSDKCVKPATSHVEEFRSGDIKLQYATEKDMSVQNFNLVQNS